MRASISWWTNLSLVKFLVKTDIPLQGLQSTFSSDDDDTKYIWHLVSVFRPPHWCSKWAVVERRFDIESCLGWEIACLFCRWLYAKKNVWFCRLSYGIDLFLNKLFFLLIIFVDLFLNKLLFSLIIFVRYFGKNFLFLLG